MEPEAIIEKNMNRTHTVLHSMSESLYAVSDLENLCVI